MPQSSSKVPPPSFVLVIGLAVFAVGMLFARIRGGADNSFLLLIEGVGLCGGVALFIFAALCHYAPREVEAFLRGDDTAKVERPSYTPPAPPKVTNASNAFEGLDFMGAWTPVAVFAVVSVVLVLVSSTQFVDPRFRGFAILISLAPIVCGIAATSCYLQEAYDDAAQWLMRGGITTFSVICIVGLCLYADLQLAVLNKGMKEFIPSTR